MNPEYDLIYVRRSDKKIFHAKRITALDYKIKDPMTGFTEPLSKYRLAKDYECQKKFSDEAKIKKACMRWAILSA